MEFQNQTFLQVLKIPDCELYQIRDHLTSYQAHDMLQVLFSKELNLFVLKLDEFYWALEPKLQILASVKTEPEDYISYLIPSIHSYFLIKVFNTTSEPIKKNFNTILENTVDFKEVPSLSRTLKSYQVHEEKHQKRIFNKVIDVISEKISPYLTVHHEPHANQLQVQSFEQLKNVGIHSVPVLDLQKTKVKELRSETKNIIQHSQENEYWREVREGITRKKSHEGQVFNIGPGDPIAGTGLTSQSMGTEIGQESEEGKPELVGKEKEKETEKIGEKEREPLASEPGISKEELESGDIPDTKLQQVPSLTYLEENAFTSGLFARKGKVEEGRGAKIDKEDEHGGFLERPFTYQLSEHGAYSLPKFPPSEYGDFRFPYVDKVNVPKEGTQEKKAETKPEPKPEDTRVRHEKGTMTHHEKENVDQQVGES